MKSRWENAHLLFWLFVFLIEGGVDAVVVFAVQMAADLAEGLPEALEMVDFLLAEELDGVSHVGITDQAKKVIIGGARLLLRGRALNSSSNYSSLNFINRQSSTDFANSLLYTSFWQKRFGESLGAEGFAVLFVKINV